MKDTSITVIMIDSESDYVRFDYTNGTYAYYHNNQEYFDDTPIHGCEGEIERHIWYEMSSNVHPFGRGHTKRTRRIDSSPEGKKVNIIYTKRG